MKIKMKVLEGPNPGEEYRFPAEGEPEDEGTNILVGRDDVECEAHWRLGKDYYVSRAHFVLEVRPPNCHVQDVQSMNGTFLRRGDAPEKRIEQEILQDGDRIRVGETLLDVAIEKEKPVRTVIHSVAVGTVLQKAQPPAEEEKDLICIRCGEMLESPPSLVGSLRDVHFMCDRCQGEVAAERLQEEEEKAGISFSCASCGADVTERANQDGRAAELSDVALYLCKNCFEEELDENSHRAAGLPKGEFGGYRLIRSLGRGGMGEVFKGVHAGSGRIAAIKQTLPIANSDERLMRRFYREISLMQQVIHPNLVRLYEAGKEGESPYFISEFVPGGDLSQFIDEDGNPTASPEEIAAIIADSLVGLSFFHHLDSTGKAMRVHRDLKPENILMVKKNGLTVPKIADFGLSKSYEDAGGATTKTGEFAGTWMYMPPEQITNFKRCTHLVDIYAMGVTLYYLLSGQSPLPHLPPPWEIEKKGGKIVLKKTPAQMVVHDERVPLTGSLSGLPEGLCTIADLAISKKQAKRPKNAEVMQGLIIKTIFGRGNETI